MKFNLPIWNGVKFKRFKDVTAISFSNDEGLLVNFHGFYSEEDKHEFTEFLFRKINMSYDSMEHPPTIH